MRISTSRVVALIFRRFYQHYPFEFGKWFFWERLLDPYINKQEARFTVSTKLGPRFNVALFDYIQQRLFYFGVWEPTLTKYISDHLKDGDVFVDVGANIGYYSCIASRLIGNNGKVHSIEASPSVHTMLRENIALNRAKNIITYNMAASDQEEIINIYRGSKANIGQTTTRIENSSKYQFQLESKIQADTLDKIIGLQNLLNARIIKIDVEGAEWQVLKGIEKFIPNFAPKTEFVIEISPESLSKQAIQPRQIVQIFEDSGYNAYVIEDDNRLSEYMRRKPTYNIYRLSGEICGQVDVLFTKAIL